MYVYKLPGVNRGVLCNELAALFEHILREVADDDILEFPRLNKSSGEEAAPTAEVHDCDKHQAQSKTAGGCAGEAIFRLV